MPKICSPSLRQRGIGKTLDSKIGKNKNKVMEYLILSLGGLVLVILASVFISRSIISKEKSAFEVDKAKLESELGFARKELDTQERVHKEAMEALERRFDETVAKVSAQLKDETSNMLKQRQKEFSETSNQSLGQIMNPLKENIAALKKVMEDIIKIYDF